MEVAGAVKRLLPALTVSFNLKPGYALGDAVEAINGAAVDALPATVTGSFQGAAQAFESSPRELGFLPFSQFLTLFVTPVFYLYMDNVREKFKKKKIAAREDNAPQFD